jgi:hypothetical protein
VCKLYINIYFYKPLITELLDKWLKKYININSSGTNEQFLFHSILAEV